MVSTFSKSCKNSFWFGSISNWSYRDNFESVYLIIYLFIYLFIYYKQILNAQKSTKRKQATFALFLAVRAKNRCLCCFLLAYFSFVSWFLLARIFCAFKICLLKKINRLKIVSIASITYTTRKKSYLQYFCLELHIKRPSLIVAC